MKRTFSFFLLLVVPLYVLAHQANQPNFEYDQQTFASFADMVYGVTKITISPMDRFKDTGRYEESWGANAAGVSWGPNAARVLGEELAHILDEEPVVMTDLGPSRWCAPDLAGPTFLSNNKECLLLYGRLPGEFHHARDIINGEITSNLYAKCVPIESSGYLSYLSVSSIAGMVKGATAADSVFMYEFPKPENIFLMNDIFEYPLGSFRKKYMSHCIGIIVLRGDGIAEVHFKMFLSDKGYMHKDKYIDKLLASIRFEE